MSYETIDTGGCVGFGDMNDPFFKAMIEGLDERRTKIISEENENHKAFSSTKTTLSEILDEFRDWVESDAGFDMFFADNGEPETNDEVEKFVNELNERFPSKKFKACPIRYIYDGGCASFDIIITDGNTIEIVTFETSY